MAKNLQEKGIEGWLAFFVFSLFASIVLEFVVGIEDVYAVASDTEVLTSTKFWLVPLGILLHLGLIIFIAYAIYSLLKLKPNAISLSKMILILTFLTNLLVVIFSYFSGEPLLKSKIFDNTQLIVRTFIFSVVWFLYLTYSKRVKNTYPIEKRKIYTIDKVFFFAIFSIPIVIYLLGFIGLAYPEESIEEIKLKRDLGKNEYSDGKVFFIKPDALDMRKNYTGIVPLYVMSKDEEMSITIVSQSTELNQDEYFEEFYKGAYEGLSGGYDLDFTIIENKEGKNSNGFDYISKTIKIEGEKRYIWSVITIFDNNSNNVAAIGYLSTYDKDLMYNKYLDEVLKFIKFS